MRKPLIVFITIIVSISHIGAAEAGYFIKINYVGSPAFEGILEEFASPKAEVGSEEAVANKKKMVEFAKTSKTKSLASKICKEFSNYNARVKILDARRGTAGLGNLKTVSVKNIKVYEYLTGNPSMSDEEYEQILEEYGDISDWPGWIEDGYVSYVVQGDCVSSGTIAVSTSNSYEIYILPDSKPKGEYLKSELIKKKWTVTFND